MDYAATFFSDQKSVQKNAAEHGNQHCLEK